jgi:hypothetical protein
MTAVPGKGSGRQPVLTAAVTSSAGLGGAGLKQWRYLTSEPVGLTAGQLPPAFERPM